MQQARRRKAVCALRPEGWTNRQIAAALSVDESTVSMDVKYLIKNKMLPASAATKSYQGKSGAPEPVNWLSTPPPGPPPPMYITSRITWLWVQATADAKENNAVNQFSNDVADAIRAGDATWVAERRMELAEAAVYVARLLAVIEDEDARRRGIHDPRERDDIGPALRAVT